MGRVGIAAHRCRFLTMCSCSFCLRTPPNYSPVSISGSSPTRRWLIAISAISRSWKMSRWSAAPSCKCTLTGCAQQRCPPGGRAASGNTKDLAGPSLTSLSREESDDFKSHSYHNPDSGPRRVAARTPGRTAPFVRSPRTWKYQVGVGSPTVWIQPFPCTWPAAINSSACPVGA
jgi:hypothetical protein